MVTPWGKRSLTWKSFAVARRRCRDKKFHKYPEYGGRGIQFKFTNWRQLLDCIGPRPLGYTLDRIDTNGHYESGNVRWATAGEQIWNRRNSIDVATHRKILEYKKLGLTARQIALMMNIAPSTVDDHFQLRVKEYE